MGYLVSVALTLSVLAIPCVTRATGVRLGEVTAVFAVHAAWVVFAHAFLYARALRSAAAFYVLAFGTVVQGSFVSLSLPVLSHQPSSPLWVAYIVSACVVGASETEGSLLFGIFHPLAPLATLPFYLRQGHALAKALPGPLVTAFAAGYGYWYLARRRENWRRDRHHREMAVAAERLAESEKERQRLSRDLHDSVGTTLSLVALTCSLAEGRSEAAPAIKRLATTVRDAALAGLDELRGVLLSLPQGPATLAELARGMTMVAQRTAAPAGAQLSLEIKAGGARVLQGSLRSALLRVFHEAVHNAVHHGRAAHIHVNLSADDSRIELEVVDDGCGFDPDAPHAGTGTAGMRARARELGGEVTIASAVGAGARIRLELPFREGPLVSAGP